jgi:RNA ligase (TIGR02306 family)
MRQLASIKTISETRPIPNADAIETALVGGWQVVIRKGEFKAGERAVYCEIDSWMPHAIAPFLSKGAEPREFEGVKGERLRTIRLRGQISQGLLLPLSVLGAPPAEGFAGDVSGILGIKLWEPQIPACLGGEARGLFPSRVAKTDQERVQNLINELPAWQGMVFEITEKLDGTSCTFYLDESARYEGALPDAFHACSRNLDMKRDEANAFWVIAAAHGLEARMAGLGLAGFAIQGEVIGPGIQGNKYKLSKPQFHVFDIYDTQRGRRLARGERLALVDKLGLAHVPTIDAAFTLENAAADPVACAEKLLELADGPSALNPAQPREGIVLKAVENGSIHFKVISNKFLLKEGA